MNEERGRNKPQDERKSEATSDETLEDLENKEKVTPSSSRSNEVHSPDGSFDDDERSEEADV